MSFEDFVVAYAVLTNIGKTNKRAEFLFNLIKNGKIIVLSKIIYRKDRI
jgi:hypothetical protein